MTCGIEWKTVAPTIMQPESPARDIIFYDGTCGLCHGFVLWTLARDRDAIFRFAPLQGETFRNTVPDGMRRELPDSVVVQTSNGRLLVRSDAAIYVAERIRSASLLVALTKFLPRAMRDALYDFIARVRYHIFGRKSDVCPIVPSDLRSRFLA
ncbi:MAG: hypothetical protein JWO13_1429 [Acidobacteriales bacterium]|nr:hypothetical protein [Terriglobales bacterium]